MLTAVATLALTFFDVISPWILLDPHLPAEHRRGMNSPAWQAIVPEVIRERSCRCRSLNSAGFNLARAWGLPWVA